MLLQKLWFRKWFIKWKFFYFFDVLESKFLSPHYSGYNTYNLSLQSLKQAQTGLAYIGLNHVNPFLDPPPHSGLFWTILCNFKGSNGSN